MERCINCKRKGIVIDCKCGLKVCLKCKVPEDHHCSFDYKLSAQYKLAINNPKIEPKKIEQI